MIFSFVNAIMSLFYELPHYNGKIRMEINYGKQQINKKTACSCSQTTKITLAAGIAVLILVIIFVLAFKGCNSKKRITTKQSRLILRLLLMTIKQQQKTTAKT